MEPRCETESGFMKSEGPESIRICYRLDVVSGKREGIS